MDCTCGQESSYMYWRKGAEDPHEFLSGDEARAVELIQ